MKIGKKIKWAILGTFGVAFLLFLTLVIHIAVMVYHKGPLPFEHVQMARADFPAPLDSLQIGHLTSGLRSQKGIRSVYFNTTYHNVVYTFDNRTNSAANIYRNVIHKACQDATLYTVSAKDMEKGCPVINNHSFYGKLTSVISKAIH